MIMGYIDAAILVLALLGLELYDILMDSVTTLKCEYYAYLELLDMIKEKYQVVERIYND